MNDRGPAAGLLLRSFLVQASWSYRGMQNLGFATMILPRLVSLGRRERRFLPSETAAKQTGFFNTHPYFAGALAGLAIRKYQESADAESFLRQEDEIKETLMGPLGAVGDDYFWAGLRPLSAVSALLIALLGYPLAAAAVFLLLYNAVHFRVRWRAGAAGLAGEAELVAWLKKANFQGQARLMRRVASLLTSLVPAAWLLGPGQPWPGGLPTGAAVTAAAFPLLVLLQALRDPRWAVAAVFAASLLTLALLGG